MSGARHVDSTIYFSSNFDKLVIKDNSCSLLFCPVLLIIISSCCCWNIMMILCSDTQCGMSCHI